MKWSESQHLRFSHYDLHPPDSPRVSGRVSDIVRNPSTTGGAWHDTWSMILGNYSSRRLTKASDRLPAISAVAKTLCSYNNDTYLAGIWKGQVRKDLLWRRASAGGQKATEWRAPSWSWASMDGRISTTYDVPISGKWPALELLGADIVPLGHDPYGRVSSGKLYVKACIKPVQPWEQGLSKFLRLSCGHTSNCVQMRIRRESDMRSSTREGPKSKM